MRVQWVLLLAAVVLAGGCTSGSSPAPTSLGGSSPVCAALAGLSGNQDDFKTMENASQPADAYAAIDRMSQRTRTAVAALQAINGAVGAEANKLAAAEGGLLPILLQFRTTTDQAGWTAARNAYTTWYSGTQAAIVDVTPRLAALGVQCV